MLQRTLRSDVLWNERSSVTRELPAWIVACRVICTPVGEPAGLIILIVADRIIAA